MATVSCPEFKVILCGEYGVGKTSLFRRFTYNKYIECSLMTASNARQSTLGLDHFSKQFSIKSSSINRQLKLQLWDTGGLERVASITNSYYKFAEAALLVFALDSLDSFHCLAQHLLEILSLAENAKIFLVGNKSDLTPHEVTDSDIELFVEQFPKFDGIYKVSCKSGEGVEEMFMDVATKLSTGTLKANFDALKLHTNNITIGDGSESKSSCGGACAK